MGEWRKSSLPVQSDKLPGRGRECAQRDDLRAVSGEGKGVGFKRSELATDSRRASGPAWFKSRQTIEPQSPHKRGVHLHSNLPSLHPPSSTASLCPTSSTSMPHKSTMGREKCNMSQTSTNDGQETQSPYQTRRNSQTMQRQDSGIATLASSSVTNL